VEKISLKPSFREILHKGNEPEVFFDILSFPGSTTQEKNLGSLIVLSYLRQKENDLSYLVSLVSSLAKREFYSPRSITEQDPKAAFERTLKKLNEILVEYFEKQDFSLNLGLAAISGDNIFISRLGRFKVALTRDNEYIDILSNVSLFSKEDGAERQFANVISGKLKAGDKIFAYFPIRSIATRERILNPLFVSEKQNDFAKKIDALAENSATFACCGIHININQIKEIPVEFNLPPVSPEPKLAAVEIAPEIGKAIDKKASKKAEQPVYPVRSVYKQPPNPESVETKPVAPIVAHPEILPEPEAGAHSIGPTNVIRAELSVAKRSNFATGLASKIAGLPIFNRTKKLSVVGRTRRSGLKWIVIAVITVVVVSSGWMLLKHRGNSAQTALVKKASDSLQLAKSRLTQNDSRDARSILQGALAAIGNATGQNVAAVKSDITKTLDIIDQVSDKKATQFADLSSQNPGFSLIAASGGNVYAVGQDNKLYSITASSNAVLGQTKSTPKFLQADNSFVSAFDGNGSTAIFDLKKSKLAEFQLKDAVTANCAVFYQNNLYNLSGGTIYKYADAVSGGITRADWGTVDNASGPLSIAADGNIFVLSKDGSITEMYKGKKTSEFTLSVAPTDQNQIFTSKDSSFIYLADAADSRVYVFDKTSGSLKTTYDVSNVGQIKNISVADDGTVWLATANSIWQVKP